jgi:uncharacterized membrane protein
MHRLALALVGLLIVLYTVVFAAVSIRQNDALETNAHDLGVMSQAAWNTLHGRFVEETSFGQPLSRLRGHVEPMFLLLALAYAVRPSANTLLVLQTVVIALGALPAYALARQRLRPAHGGLAERPSAAAGVVFALAYLLFPALEAANLTEFHPVALVAPLFLAALYFLQRRSYPWFLLFTLLAVSCKEDMALLAVLLGLYVAIGQRQWRLGLGLAAAGAIWFVLAVYVVIPAFSPGGNVLFERYAELGGSPQGVLRTLLTRPGDVLGSLLAPARLGYVGGLLAAVGGLALLDPALLLVAAPSFGINLLSNYPTMYSGISHYSAPIVPFLIAAAIGGASWLVERAGDGASSRRRLVLVVVLAWVLLTSLGYHRWQGFSPLGGRWRWPPLTAHARLLPRFLAQIPADAAVTTQPPLYPHLSARQHLYLVPALNDAAYVLLDVTARSDMHPNDLHDLFQRLVSSGDFTIADAADGYILLRRGVGGARQLPDEFYSFARLADPRPQYPVVLDFGESLRLLGFDVFEQVEEGKTLTGLRLYWQVRSSQSAVLSPQSLRLYPFFYDQEGQIIEDTSRRPIVNTLWYPPSQWQPGETLVMTTLPWTVGDDFGIGLGVVAGDWVQVERRLPVRVVGQEYWLTLHDDDTWATLGTGQREHGRLELQVNRRLFSPPPIAHPRRATLGGQIALLGYDLSHEPTLSPGDTLTVTLYWQALGPLEQSYTVFNHLMGPDGRLGGQLGGQEDGLPVGGARPTTTWAPGEVIVDRYRMRLRPDASVGDYQLVVGMYRLETLARLPVQDAAGQPSGDYVLLTTMRVGQ